MSRAGHELTPECRDAAAELLQLRRLQELDALLPALAGILDLREVFGRVSEIARKALSHDLLGVTVIEEAGSSVRVYATAGALPPDAPHRVSLEEEGIPAGPWEHTIIADVATETAAPLSRRLRDVALRGGLRSLLRVPIRLEGRIAGVLNFASRERGRYTPADLVVATRIRDFIALAVSHQRLSETRERLAAERERSARAEKRARSLTEELAAAGGHGRVVGESKPWKAVISQVGKVAPTETTVLVTGESGTGKEVVARLIHRGSPRAAGPFVAINCAALPENLLESELFGFERGAFSGAVQTKPGRIELAAGGVLFLDEIGEMSLVVQAKLLRFLEQREFQRLGGAKTLRADVRVVAATNRDLKATSGRGEFREDLYYRVSVFEVRTPPLRERPDDILALAQTLLADIARSLGRPPAGISREALDLLLAYRWPGNVRELRNVLERASILCEGGLIGGEHLAISEPAAAARAPPSVASEKPGAGGAVAGDADLAAMERATIERILAESRFNKSRAAKRLGITRGQLYLRLKKYGLEAGESSAEVPGRAE